MQSIDYNWTTCTAEVTIDCWGRYQREKKFGERYYGTELYGMCRSRALARFEVCRDGLDPDGPGPLDPLEWPDAPEGGRPTDNAFDPYAENEDCKQIWTLAHLSNSYRT